VNSVSAGTMSVGLPLNPAVTIEYASERMSGSVEGLLAPSLS
jgi:hypothetical protein